ncbi:MAG: hypothetical protein ABL893_03820 [Hyphomicrobium sp.]
MTASHLIPVVAILCTGLLTGVSSALAADRTGGAVKCLMITSDAERLACFDREVRKLVDPKFAGRLNLTTDPFDVVAPARLRFQSAGAIFVLYLKRGKDEVVQNLHIGGGGEDSYVIETSGTYFLQINGSEGWRIWLEPM